MDTTEQKTNSICPYYKIRFWKDGDDENIATVANPYNDLGDKYDTCRVFFSYTDLHIFSTEHPLDTVPDMTFVLNRIENLPKLRDILPQYDNVSSFQCRIFKAQRFTWAHNYTRENLEEFFSNFLHDYEHLNSWCP